MRKCLGLGIGVVGVVLFLSIRSSVWAERLDLERSLNGLNLRLRDVVAEGPAVLEPRYRVERSFDLQTWAPVGELLRTGAGSHVLEVNSDQDSIGFFRVRSLPFDLTGADLSGLDFSELSLREAKLNGADLRYANLAGADLSNADLTGADLRGADLRMADLNGAILKDAALSGANLIGIRKGPDATLPDGGIELPGSGGIGSELGFPEEADLLVPGAAPLPPMSAPPLSPVLDGRFGTVAASAPVPGPNLGFAVGGANDVGNFRQNIENEFLPLYTDVTYEGLFYDYFFDTGQTDACESLFCPSYAQALSPDPFSEKEERYLSVGLNSGIPEADFVRKQLNLTVVIDV